MTEQMKIQTMAKAMKEKDEKINKLEKENFILKKKIKILGNLAIDELQEEYVR